MERALVSAAMAALILATTACDKTEPKATETSSATTAAPTAPVADPKPAAEPKAAAAPAAPAWPGKKDDDVVIGAVDELAKDGTCTVAVLTAEQVKEKPGAQENMKAFFGKVSKGAFAEGKGCPAGEHLAGVCFSKQMSSYAFFYTSGGTKSWTEAEAKEACAKKMRGKWSEP